MKTKVIFSENNSSEHHSPLGTRCLLRTSNLESCSRYKFGKVIDIPNPANRRISLRLLSIGVIHPHRFWFILDPGGIATRWLMGGSSLPSLNLPLSQVREFPQIGCLHWPRSHGILRILGQRWLVGLELLSLFPYPFCLLRCQFDLEMRELVMVYWTLVPSLGESIFQHLLKLVALVRPFEASPQEFDFLLNSMFQLLNCLGCWSFEALRFQVLSEKEITRWKIRWPGWPCDVPSFSTVASSGTL